MSVPQNIMVVGNLIGTGAALKVSCGFVPRRVEVLNLTQLSRTTWNYGMTTNWDEGFHEIDSGAGAVDFSLLTANGISTNTGDVAYTTVTGTIAGSAGSAAITGTSTEFLTEVAVGDELLIGGIVYSVIAVASDTALTIDRPLSAAASGAAVVRVTGRQAGFTIGTTSTLNTNNDVISYVAFR